VGRWLQRLPRVAGLLLFAAWMAVVWWLSSQPSADAPPVFWRSWGWNCGHAPLFGLLAFWGVLALPREGGWPRIEARAALGILLAVLAYAVVDELHQSRAVGRVASPFDVLTDGVGAACTLWIAAYLGRAEATARGLHGRLVLGLAACALAGLLSTWASMQGLD